MLGRPCKRLRSPAGRCWNAAGVQPADFAGGYAHPILPCGGTVAGRDACQRLNLAIADANANAAELPRLASPVIGSVAGGDILETLEHFVFR